jgi:hypothetical protein
MDDPLTIGIGKIGTLAGRRANGFPVESPGIEIPV